MMNTSASRVAKADEPEFPNTHFVDIFPPHRFNTQVDGLTKREDLESQIATAFTKIIMMSFREDLDEIFDYEWYTDNAPKFICDTLDEEIEDQLKSRGFTDEMLMKVLGLFVSLDAKNKLYAHTGKSCSDLSDSAFRHLFDYRPHFTSILNFLIECDLRYSVSARRLLKFRLLTEYPKIQAWLPWDRIRKIIELRPCDRRDAEDVFSVYSWYFRSDCIRDLRRMLILARDGECGLTEKLRIMHRLVIDITNEIDPSGELLEFRNYVGDIYTKCSALSVGLVYREFELKDVEFPRPKFSLEPLYTWRKEHYGKDIAKNIAISGAPLSYCQHIVEYLRNLHDENSEYIRILFEDNEGGENGK